MAKSVCTFMAAGAVRNRLMSASECVDVKNQSVVVPLSEKRLDTPVEMPGNKKVRALFFSLSCAHCMLYMYINRDHRHSSDSDATFFVRSFSLHASLFLCSRIIYAACMPLFPARRRRIYFHASTPRFATIFCHQKRLNESEFLNSPRAKQLNLLPTGTRPSPEILLLCKS
jgi:hypothetical protein